MPRRYNRRAVMAGLAGIPWAAWPLLTSEAQAAAATSSTGMGPATPFSFDIISARARETARKPYVPAERKHADILDEIGYDSYQQIRFRKDASFRLGPNGRPCLQLFHLAKLFTEPVRVHLIENGTSAQEILYTTALFETPGDHPARRLPGDTGFAGFRLMDESGNRDWLAFLGASYFRSSGPFNQYGLSARGLAIDTGMPKPEEFPRFTEFWLGGGNRAATTATIYALLDSPSVAGAYKIEVERLTDTRDIHRVIMTIEARLYARTMITRLGIAPFSSMFWYGEATRTQAADWRPEIHDSDGLAIYTGAGERIWRPIVNPPRVMTNAFVDRDPKGFGLLQRDRDFVHYLDDGVFYERRSSVWVEPLEPWGEGAVHLLEIPTNDETFDNIVAYWCPKGDFAPGAERRYRYTLTWLDDIPFPENLGRATATWTGLGGRPGFKRPQGVRKFVIDFQGPVFDGLGRNDGVEIVVTTSRGTVSNAYTHPVVDQRNRWRALFDLEAAGSEPVDLRAFLRKGPRALTETWIYQHFPEA